MKNKGKFAPSNIHADTVEGKKARLAYIAGGTHGDGKSNSAHPGDKRTLGQKLYQAG